ncbi:MAG: T9SS type A sorting domain-containing protein [Cytophagaceae bacterium]|nr:T9SS type A sorting domain-containing protein [Cytophagaceae bacterium]
MKKLLLLAITLSATSLLAQYPPNAGLENWDPLTIFGSSAETPAGWLTPNLATGTAIPGSPNPNTNPVSVTKVTDRTEGNFAMRIRTVTLSFNPSPDYIPNVGGVAFVGTPIISFLPPSFKIKEGFPVSNFAPTAVSFDMKYFPVNSDVGGASILLTKWNGTSRDTIATAIQFYTSEIASYTATTINLTYDPAFTGIMADTCQVAFASSDPDGNPQDGSDLFIDNIVFTDPAGNKAALQEDGFMIFPNPSSDRIQVVGITKAEKYSIYSSDGKKVASGILSSEYISTEGLKAGQYSLQLESKDDKVLSNKLIVLAP